MCSYRYVYYSRCGHAEFYKYTYCNKAYALGQPQRDAQRLLGDYQAGYLGHCSKMSTLTPAEAGGTCKLPESQRTLRLPHADLVPRSIQHDASLDTPDYRNLNIDISLDTPSSVSMELTNDAQFDRTGASSAATVRPLENTASVTDVDSPTTPRRSIPSQWRTTPRAPVLMTQIRGEEREKRKSNSQSGSPISPQTAHKSASGSPLRKSKSTIKISVSPNKGSVDNHGRTHSSSTEETVFHSARHSPVSQSQSRGSASSPTSFVTAHEQHDGMSHYALSEADDLQNYAHGTVSSLSRVPIASHVKASVAGNKATMSRPAAPKLSLRIPPHTSSSTDRKSLYVSGSASSSGSGGTSASPARSRIPRALPVESVSNASSTKAAQAKFPVAAKATTPETVSTNTIRRKAGQLPRREDRVSSTSVPQEPAKESSNLDKHAMVASYLEKVEPTDLAKDIAEKLSRSVADTSSRATSTSTVKPTINVDPVLQDEAVVSYRKQSDVSEPHPAVSPIRGRSSDYVPRDRKQTQSDLSATAPEFIPYQQEPEVAPPYLSTGFPFDPYALDMYGIPWYYHMYPVPIQGIFSKSPRKRRTFPQTRKRGGSSPSKNVPRTLAAQAEGPEPEPVPFSQQLEEIARNAAARHNKKLPKPATPNFQATPTPRHQSRGPRNGLYDTVGRCQDRLVGLPIDATTPFPTPMPPSGRRDNVGYTIVKREPTCGVIHVEKAAEWGGGICNKCDPDH